MVGGLIGSIGVGAVAGKATEKVLGTFIVDDAEEMVRIIEKVFSEMVIDYLLNQKEAEKAVDNLGKEISGKILKDMFASDDRKAFARKLLTPIIENEGAKRVKIRVPTNEQMSVSLKEVLEEISDDTELAFSN